MNINTSGIKEVLRKIRKKDPVLFRAIQKKIDQIAELSRADIEHFKNLRGDLSSYKRVHVGKHFILMFKVEEYVLIFDRFDHHDGAY